MIRRLSSILRMVLSAVIVLGMVSVAPAVAEPSGLIWERPSSPGSWPFDVAVDIDGSYYVACVGSATVEKFDSAGAHQWTFSVMSNFEDYSPNVDVDDTGVYISISGGTVAKLAKSDGGLVWEASGIPGGYRVIQDIAAYGGHVYVTQPGMFGSFFTLDATTGVYEAPFPSVLPDPWASYYGVAVDSGGVYVVTNEYAVRKYAFDGTMIWGTTENRDTGGAPSLSADGAYLYVPSDSTAEVYKLSTVDGSIIDVLSGQDGCNGVDVDSSGMLLTVAPYDDLVRAYTEPWPEPVEEPVAQTIDNGIVKFTVQATGRPQAYVWGWDPMEDEDAWVHQYYSEDGWGTSVYLDGSGYDSGYVGLDEEFTPVSNDAYDIPGGQQIVTVLGLGDSGVVVVQTITLMDGDRFVTKTWNLVNFGDESYTDVRMYHGGDTYFGGEDSAWGFYNPAKSMVYVRNEDFANWGIMGFFANPATPASHYFEGYYSDGRDYAGGRENLPDDVLGEFEDAGYYLQWDRVGLDPGDSWTVQAYEVWTPGGPIQLLAPGTQNVIPGTTVTLSFTLQNLSEVPQDVVLAAATDAGWDVTIVGDTTPDIQGVTTMDVLVEVTVPGDATGSCAVTLSATGPETDVSASTRLDVSELDVSIEPAALSFEAPVLGSDTDVVTITNNGETPIVLGSAAADSEFSSDFGGATVQQDESVEVEVTFEPSSEGSFTGTLRVPVLSPELATLTVRLTGDTVVSQFTLNYSAGEGGSIEGSALQFVNEGADGAEVVAVADPHYAFVEWSDGLDTAARTDTEVAEDLDVTAYFEAVPVEFGGVAGASRYSTAVQVSQDAFPDGADAVVIATGEKYPDALGGSALAGVLDAPILLTKHDMLISEVADEIERLGAEEVYVLGGVRAVSDGVSNDLAELLGVQGVHRIGGPDRYRTAELVAQQVADLQGESYDGNAFVATGDNYADALAASPLAAANGWPVYLAPRPAITAATIAAMQAAGVTDVILLGGDAAMPEGTEVTILGAGFTAVRIDGADRYETAAKVAEYGVVDAGMSWDGVAIATGEAYADALAGGAAQGYRGSVMLLTRGDELPAATESALRTHSSDINALRYLGGLGAVSQSVRDAVAALW